MKGIKLTTEEIESTRNALKFYRDETTHNPDGECAGLPEGKERSLLTSVIIKLEDKE